MYIPWAAKFLLLLPPPKPLREGRHKTLKFAQEAIQEQKNCPAKDDGKTMVGNMLKAVDPETGGKLSDVDILSNANILMYHIREEQTDFSVAASDTTATALMFILYHLVAQRKYWDRLSTEIRSRFKSSDEITNASTTSIPFLDAVIHEGTSSLYVVLS
jgi:cytochrome P450